MDANRPLSRPLYEEIGRSYSRTRREDPRIAAEIVSGLGGARSVVNVGAGTGSYEPGDRVVVAVEPSPEMVRQRRGRTRRVVRGVAEALPFADGAFEAAMAVLTIHHWADPGAGLGELARVARRQVVFFFEPLRTRDFWVLDYFPEALDLPSEQDPPGEDAIRRVLRVREVRRVLVPHDCLDGFGAAFWGRPEAYLDPEVQAGMSWLALLTPEARHRGSERLAADLASGAWDRRHGHLRHQRTYDGGYRLAIAESGPPLSSG
jgi:SAM-dependent methyltransferase